MLAEHGTFHHVYDFYSLELPFGIEVPLPYIGGDSLHDAQFAFSKFMVLQLVAFAIAFWIFRGLAKRMQGGRPVNGWFWNFWEMLAVYIRDEVVRPVIGDPHAHGHGDHHDDHEPSEYELQHGPAISGHPADKYLPFIWSCFFYILFCNLLGAVPWLGSATGSLSVTIALALVAFGATYIYGSQMHGPVGFWTHMIPHIDAPIAMKLVLIPLIFGIEIIGLFIKHAVLAVRLFANIMGGHTVLGVILGFIAAVAHHGAWSIVAPASLAGQVGVGLLELLVAFIQAYVFSFLSTIFIAMSLHEH
ncbi:MAG: F0F1 ATP synthase subunit A [Planctomycetaceae bacterium]|nr:F0F1 ATP synthase subunit A [Planctomycetaceae bacterium]